MRQKYNPKQIDFYEKYLEETIGEALKEHYKGSIDIRDLSYGDSNKFRIKFDDFYSKVTSIIGDDLWELDLQHEYFILNGQNIFFPIAINNKNVNEIFEECFSGLINKIDKDIEIIRNVHNLNHAMGKNDIKLVIDSGSTIICEKNNIANVCFSHYGLAILR